MTEGMAASAGAPNRADSNSHATASNRKPVINGLVEALDSRVMVRERAMGCSGSMGSGERQVRSRGEGCESHAKPRTRSLHQAMGGDLPSRSSGARRIFPRSVVEQLIGRSER